MYGFLDMWNVKYSVAGFVMAIGDTLRIDGGLVWGYTSESHIYNMRKHAAAAQ